MENTKTMNVPAESAFALSKVKILGGGGLAVHYDVTEVSGSESYTNHYQVESSKDVHPDLARLFTDLRPIVGRVFGLTSFLSMLDVDEFGATEVQRANARTYADEMLNRIDVRGVSLSGQGDNVGVVLSAQFTVANNQQTAINTPRIKYNTFSFGFEEELEQIVADIEREVYAFLFKGKRAQLSLFGDEPDAPEVPETENDAE